MAQRTARKRAFWLLNNTLNRATSWAARSGHGPFSLIRHVENVNWYRNIVAAGGCVVVHHRVEYRVNQIEPVDADRGHSAFPPPFRTILKATGRSEFRRLHTDRPPVLGG